MQLLPGKLLNSLQNQAASTKERSCTPFAVRRKEKPRAARSKIQAETTKA